jgi:hypothetical protein
MTIAYTQVDLQPCHEATGYDHLKAGRRLLRHRAFELPGNNLPINFARRLYFGTMSGDKIYLFDIN